MTDYILIVEDDSEINQMLTTLLQNSGYRTLAAYSGTEALLCLERQKARAVILDLMLPGMAGEELLQKIKERDPALPVIVASAREDVQTKVALLRSGADDYIVKPFDTEELLARLEAALRRSGGNGGGNRPGGKIVFKDIELEPEEYRVRVSGQEVAFTKRELLILELLMSNPNKVFTKSNIYESVWNDVICCEL